jgi:hypothetical protein
MPWLCGIHDHKPEFCKKYPQSTSFVPQSCGFYFLGDGIRRGACRIECEASCCRVPRMNGDPDGASIPEAAGGTPCKHLVWTDHHVKFDAAGNVETIEGVSNQPDTAEVISARKG